MSIRGIYILLSAALSIFCGWLWGDLLYESRDNLSGIIDVFAILAAVLVAVISIIGDPSMLMPGNWRVGYEHAKDIQEKISRFSHLFTIYIIIIFLVLFVQFITNAEIKELYFLYKALLSITMFGFLLSVPLPYALMDIQKERMREEIKRRPGGGGT